MEYSKIKYKVGDLITDKQGNLYYIWEINKDNILIKTDKKFLSTCTPFQPKYRVGDIIKYENKFYEIFDITDNYYSIQNIVDKTICAALFDIENFCTTPELKPFDKVLVKNEDSTWKTNLFEKKVGDLFYCMNGIYKYCILYTEETAKLINHG